MLPKIIYATVRQDGAEKWIEADRDFKLFKHADIIGVYELHAVTRKVETLETLPTKSRQRKVKAAK
jgi:hypothetical protein